MKKTTLTVMSVLMAWGSMSAAHAATPASSVTYVCASAARPTAVADEGADPKTPIAARYGTVTGVICDADGLSLSGALVTIDKQKLKAVSDADGCFRLTNILPGTYKLKVQYVGYAPAEATVTVKAGQTAAVRLELRSGTTLSEVEVRGSFTGQARAINTQKNNLNLTNVVSADQVGKFPDSNIGDALKRFPGIYVQ